MVCSTNTALFRQFNLSCHVALRIYSNVNGNQPLRKAGAFDRTTSQQIEELKSQRENMVKNITKREIKISLFRFSCLTSIIIASWSLSGFSQAEVISPPVNNVDANPAGFAHGKYLN